ncbi:eCIS core domain-containing protein [Streptomyces chattanoogensis]|uniref:eCIS core domain-containing protein n=1 Tax=Streptomyces chattanoogensis TaxID=66876 RepID=UPI0036B8D754
MSAAQASAQETRAAREEKRRKRKERAASRAPEPKDIVSGAGQPLDLSVRRELEEQLGHDFSQVRLHTDRDSGQLAEMMGADAFAVGQDIFFREGTYRPGTADGQRLLAHELLHTVQNPHGLGALRAGRDLGSVSLPQEGIEREAESAAQETVRAAMLGSVRSEAEAEVGPGQATPGWLRYATVDADRRRMELLDPATLVDRLANSVVRSVRGDPEDRSKRTRMQLARLPEELQDAVLARLENRLLSPELERVLDLVDEAGADDGLWGDGLEQNSLGAPFIEPDAAEALQYERESERRTAEERRAEEREPAVAPGPEKERPGAEGAAGSTPRNGGTREDGSTPQGGPAAAPQQRSSSSAGGRSGEGRSGEGRSPAGSAGKGEQAGGEKTGGEKSGGEKSEGEKGSDGKSSDGKPGAGQQGGEKKPGAEGGKEGADQKGAPAASKEESAAKNRPGAADSLVAGQQPKPQDRRGQEKPSGSPARPGAEAPAPGPLSTLDGVRNQDLDGPEEKDDEDPFGSGGESEVEVGGGEGSAWDVKLQPEDFLPEQDLDIPAVPAADNPASSSSGGSGAPSFPAPPVTKADKVQAEREAEDAEDASEPEPEEDEGVPPGGTEAADGTEGGGPRGDGPGGLALEQAAAARPGPGAVSKDPKSGADPKAGPVDAQVTVQEAPGAAGSGGETKEKEQSAKQEKGTPAGGERAGGGQEQGAQQPAGGKSAAGAESGGKGEQKQADPAAPGKSEPGAGAQASSPARDGHVSGGSPADTAGGTQHEPAGGAPKGEQGSRTEGGAGAAPEASAGKDSAAAEPRKGNDAPAAAPEPAKAPEAPAAAPAPKAAPKAAASKPAPAAKAAHGGGGGGRGGGGGGSAAAPAKKGKKDSGPAPNLANVSPEAGLSTAAKLKPHKALAAMSGVGGSVDRTVGEEHKALAAAPPSMERPAGAPQTLQGKPKADAAAQYSQDPAKKSDAPEQEKAEVEGAKEPEGQIEAEKAEEPGGWQTFKMALGFGVGKVLSWMGFKVDASELAAKFAGLPTKDEALKKAQAGRAPGVQMQGAADDKAREQGDAVDGKGQETVTTARDDAGRGMGEDQVYPNAPKEQLKAKVPGGEGGKGGVPKGGSSTGAVPPEAASEVAEHDRGPQFQAAFGDGQKGMSKGRQTKDRDFRDSQAKHKQKVDTEVATNTGSQAGEREKAMTEVTSQRADWRTEQNEELNKLGTKKTERHEKVRKDVKDHEKKTDDDAEKEKKDSDKKIQDRATKAEEDADKKKNDSANESGNWVTKAFDWIKEKVIEIKNAIVRVIREARRAVVDFIKNFKERVERLINEARKFIVDTVKNLINDLIEFAKNMVRAVIELANRIRKFITSLIQAAIALVNKLATMLKQIIKDLLDAIGKLLSNILNILKKMLQDVIKAVVDAIKTVLEYASKLLSALGDFMLIAVDFLSDPGGWISGAKNSAVDGAKNHLFREVKSAVKEWFQSKIEEIIGVPKAIIEKLIKGGFTLEKIVKETWDAVVPMLPVILGEIIITKVIAKLIPGAGWVMAVIDAIRTAIGALGAILRAMGAVLDWLKAVRQGGAGILFAKAIAAGVVALLELAYQALLNGIGKYVAKVGKRLKGIAAKLGKGGKGDKPGGGKGAGDGRKPQDQAPKRDGAEGRPAASRPTSTKPRPGDNPDLSKPTPHDKPGNPKDPAAKPDTRPTPSPKPKPQPEPRPKPKPEPEPKPKPKDDSPNKPKEDKGPNKPKDDKDTPAKPKPDKDTDQPGKPKDKHPDQDPKKPKDKPDKNPDGNKPKPGDKHDDPKKPKNDKNDKNDPKKPKPKDDKGPKKPRHNKPKDGRPKDKHPDKDRQDKKDQRKKEENSKESKDERLRKIAARLRPRLRRLLQHGVSPLVLSSRLAMWKLWYRLSALSHGQDGFFSARLNPSITLDDPKGKNVDAAELSTLLTPIGREAYDAYVASLQTAIAAGRGRFAAGQEYPLEGLSKIEMQQVLGRQQPPTENIRLLPGVRNHYPAHQMPPHWRQGDIGHIQMNPSKYEKMAASLFARAAALNIPEELLARALATGAQGDIQKLRPADVPIGPLRKTKMKAVESFQNRVRSVATLYHAGEPARNNDVAVPQAIASSILDAKTGRGLQAGQLQNESHRVIAGDHAPMSMQDAHRRTLSPAKQQAVDQLRAERVGSIIIELLQQAQRGPLVTSANHDLRPLADSIRQWLAAHFNGKPPQELTHARDALKAQFIALLKSYDG